MTDFTREFGPFCPPAQTETGMTTYLKFYDLEKPAFGSQSESKVVLGTKALRDALSEIRSGIETGATRICVNGQSGMGKTSLARALPKLLDDDTRVALILRPSTSWNSIRSSIAKQWKVGEGGIARSNLLNVARDSKLILVIDQAETAAVDLQDLRRRLLARPHRECQPACLRYIGEPGPGGRSVCGVLRGSASGFGATSDQQAQQCQGEHSALAAMEGRVPRRAWRTANHGESVMRARHASCRCRAISASSASPSRRYTVPMRTTGSARSGQRALVPVNSLSASRRP